MQEETEKLKAEIEKLKKDINFYKEWNEHYINEITERNRKGQEVLAKLKGIKALDLFNLSEIDVWEEIEKIVLNKDETTI